MKKLAAMCLAGTLAIAGAGTAMAEDDASMFAAENFSATLTFTTNYMYRGISFSRDDEAIQGSFDWSAGNFFAGVWGSSLADQDGSGYELETDWYGGYFNSFAGIDWFVMPIYYHFGDYKDKTNGNVDADVFEVWLDGTYAINDTFTLHSMYAYSPDFFFESGNSHYIKADITANLPAGFSLNVGVGRQVVEGDNKDYLSGRGWSYNHWEIGLSKELAGFNFDLRYHDTSDDAKNNLVTEFTANEKINDDVVVFTVSRSF